MEICYNHVFIYAEFEIINMFFKERRSKSKPAYATFSKMFIYKPRFQFGHGHLVKSYGKVLEIHWSKCVGTLRGGHKVNLCCGSLTPPLPPAKHGPPSTRPRRVITLDWERAERRIGRPLLFQQLWITESLLPPNLLLLLLLLLLPFIQ